jgi:peroxiredoxin
MRLELKFVSIIILIALLLTGRTTAAAPTSEEVMMDKPADSKEMMDKPGDEEMQKEDESMDKSDDAMMEDKPGEVMEKEESVMEEKDDAMMTEAPDWFRLELQEVTSGETFTIESLKGQVVLVETMAQWCSSCLRQQKEVKVLHEQLGERDDFVSLGLNIDPNESAEALKEYVARNGFDWLYAVSPADVSREISNLYGAQFLNPPATPMLLIDRQGEVHVLPFGVKSAQTLLDALQPFLDESM